MQSILFVLQMLLRPLGKQAYGTDVCAHRNARHNWSSSANTTRRRGIRRYKMAVSSATHLPSGPQKKNSRKALSAKRSCRYDRAVTSITLSKDAIRLNKLAGCYFPADEHCTVCHLVRRPHGNVYHNVSFLDRVLPSTKT